MTDPMHDPTQDRPEGSAPTTTPSPDETRWEAVLALARRLDALSYDLLIGGQDNAYRSTMAISGVPDMREAANTLRNLAALPAAAPDEREALDFLDEMNAGGHISYGDYSHLHALITALAARPAPVVPEGDGSWWGPESCHDRECEDFGDPKPGEKRLDPEIDWPCSHVVWVPARIEKWIRESEREDRPAPVVSGADAVIEYVAMVISDPKYGHDAEWLRLNLHPSHLRQIATRGLTVTDEGRADVPEMFPGTHDALDVLTIRPGEGR